MASAPAPEVAASYTTAKTRSCCTLTAQPSLGSLCAGRATAVSMAAKRMSLKLKETRAPALLLEEAQELREQHQHLERMHTAFNNLSAALRRASSRQATCRVCAAVAQAHESLTHARFRTHEPLTPSSHVPHAT